MTECPSYARRGAYIGTTIRDAWWRRYRRSGFLARGSGRYWLDGRGFHFLRALTKRPLLIPASAIVRTSTSSWHAGRWGGGIPILRIHWERDGVELISGFVVARGRDAVDKVARDITAFASRG
ncbi:MAG: hypothetical protein GF405_10255 [Candidatus Eisenbacteria bacterium]|nr:hypothetical protein [Candidatus Eisenbacteria bacterium]